MYKKVGIASVIMTLSVFLSRVIGLVREMVIGYAKGIGVSVDAYQVAFVIPEILNHVLASGFLSITFIPIFSDYLAGNKERDGWMVFSNILTCFGCLILVFIAVSMLAAPAIIDLTGFQNPETKLMAVKMTRIILPAQFFFFTGGLFMAVQFAKEQFLIPALAPLIYNAGIILFGILFSPSIGMEGFSWGVLAGAFLGNFALQLYGARKAGMRYRFVFQPKHPDFKTYIILTLPLMLGLTMVFSTEILFKFFGSYLPEGSVSSLNYSWRVMFVLVGIFGQAVGVASYPFMARLISENKMDEMNDLLNNTLKYIALVIPFSTLVMVLRHEVILMLFQRGRFDAEATALTSNVLVYILIGTVAFSAQTIVARGYYAMKNTLFPTVYGTIAVILSIPLYILGMNKMGVTGIALAMSVSVIFQVLILYILWNRKSGNTTSRSVYLFIIKISLISAPIGLFLEKTRMLLSETINANTFFGSFQISLVISLVFILLFTLTGYLFRIIEIIDFISKITLKLKKT